MDVLRLLANEGADICAYDPMVREGDAHLGTPFAGRLAPTAIEAASGADALAVLTDWPEFAEVDLAQVRAVMRGNVIFDGRNLLGKKGAEEAGFAYIGVGRPSTAPRRRTNDA